MSGFQRNKLPPLPDSGVKNPAPDAIGADFSCKSSAGDCLTGSGRGGNSSSISGTSPIQKGSRIIHNSSLEDQPSVQSPSNASQTMGLRLRA